MKKLLSILLLLTSLQSIAQEARLMRFPTIHDNQIVFSYAGDLYTVSKLGGEARKLTSDIGYEMFASLSPDGKHIAFTAQYDGNTEVYVLDAIGGSPKRLTYTATLGRDDIADRMGPNNIVMGWRDNETIVYRSRKESFNDFVGQLFLVNINGGLSNQLPLPAGGFNSYCLDKTKLAYNRIFREFRTWKYYKGGMADDISIYDFESKKTERITSSNSQDMQPMWFGNKIYFLSDRDRTMNIFCYDINTKQTNKITNYTDYDVKFPSLGNNSIIYEQAGYLYVLDLPSEKISKVSVTINSDNIYGRTDWIDASKNIEGTSISPDGKRVSIIGRGDLFSVPSESGITRNISQTSGVHERNATWSPDGKYIAYVSDATGEDEIYIQIPDGVSKTIQITSGSDNYKFELSWSPDSKKIMWGDKKYRLQYVDINTKVVSQIDKSNYWEMRDFTWSPDSKWVAYARKEDTGKDKVWMYNIINKQKIEITDGWYTSSSPVFSNDGKYLYLISDRDFNPTFSGTDFEIAYTNMSKIYLLTLAKATANPFAPENDEVIIKKDSSNTSSTDGKSKKGDTPKPSVASKDIIVDADGIAGRLLSLEIDAANYYNLYSAEGKVYYMKSKEGGDESSLCVFDLKEKKETVIGALDGFDLSFDLKKMLVVKKGARYVIDAPSSKLDLTKLLDVSNMKMFVNKKEEWNQIFNESWRQMRDFFYAPNMHGVDWIAIKSKYAPLIPYVNHRADLTYIIGEMIGELSVGHAYCGGGDQPKPERIKLGLLGAKLSKDASGYFQINKILSGANYNEELRSPLTEVGIDVKAGDYIISVNGIQTNTVNDIYSLLINTAGKQVEITVNSKPVSTGARKIIIIPIEDESNLYYYNWVQHNIHFVDSVSGGKIGYLHVPNMGVEGLNEFMKYFYPQIQKKALIIDDRGNGGGFVSPLLADRLSKELIYYKFNRNSLGSPDPEAHYGPKVLLMNEYSASDGDIFPYRFKTYKLGKTIGKRSWGGVVGIRGSLPFVDGGFLNRPEFAPYLADGFVIEGYGVDPDIVVDNDPGKEFAGIDEQLNRAIEELLNELKTKEQSVPPVPPFPYKSK